MASRAVIALLAIMATAAVAQQYNIDYDYDQGAQAQPQRQAAQPQQRSFSRPAPTQQTLRSTGPAVTRQPPVAILKQINRHNDDGSYTYGYEGADGSFKIETKTATGEVNGKYGYVDDSGKLRTVEYGANKYGFQPSGEGITVAPPTLVDETRLAKGDRSPDYDDGQYYEEQQPIRQQAPKAPKRTKAPQRQQPQQYFENSYQEQRPQQYHPQPNPQTFQAQPQQFQSQPQPQQFQPQPQQFQPQQQQYQPQPPPSSRQAALRSQGPEPARLQVSGAAPAPSNDGAYRPQAPRQFAQPQQAPRQFPSQPAPVHQFQPQQPIQRPPQHARAGSGSGFFDQLMKDYALPQGGSSTPLHDISFGVGQNY